MKKLFSIFVFGLIANFVQAQNIEPVYEKVDAMAEFPGGITEMINFIGQNLKYPKPAARANVTGKVFVKMIIEKDGSISSPKIVKGIGFGCDEEVMRVVGLMPKWSAARLDGKVVRSSMVMPVMFALDHKKSK